MTTPTPPIAEPARRTLDVAMEEAEEFRDRFPRECYERWRVAGSVRRRMPTVKDVDHVVIPTYGEAEIAGNLFGAKEKVNLLLFHLDALVRRGEIAMHERPDGSTAWGTKQRACTFRGMKHEIWSADKDNFGAQLAIRTGPGEYSHMLVMRLQQHGHMNIGGYVYDKGTTNCICGWSGREPNWERTHPDSPGRAAARMIRAPGREEESYALCPGCARTDTLSMPRVSVPEEEDYFRHGMGTSRKAVCAAARRMSDAI